MHLPVTSDIGIVTLTVYFVYGWVIEPNLTSSSRLSTPLPSIKFTVEYGGNSINFLDVRIFIKNGRPGFGITVHGSFFFFH